MPLCGVLVWFDFIDMWHCVLIISQLLAFSCEEVLSLNRIGGKNRSYISFHPEFWKRIIVSSYQNVQNVGTVHHAIFNFFGFRVCSPVKQIFDNPQSVKAFYSISEESILSAVTLLWEYPCVLSYTCWALEFAEGAPNSP